MSLTYIITFHANEHSLEAFKELLQQVKINLPKVEGCQGVKILSNIDTPTMFTLVETWSSQELHQSNSQKLVQSGDWGFILGLLAREPAGNYFKEI